MVACVVGTVLPELDLEVVACVAKPVLMELELELELEQKSRGLPEPVPLTIG